MYAKSSGEISIVIFKHKHTHSIECCFILSVTLAMLLKSFFVCLNEATFSLDMDTMVQYFVDVPNDVNCCLSSTKDGGTEEAVRISYNSFT